MVVNNKKMVVIIKNCIKTYFESFGFVSDSRKGTVPKSSTTASSEFPYPPAFKQSTQSIFQGRPGSFSQGIPGLDMPNTEENEGNIYRYVVQYPKSI